MAKATNWDDAPLLLTIDDQRKLLGYSREQAYAFAHLFGRRVGGKMLTPKAAIRNYFEGAHRED